jgi:hypothetical protein
MAPLLLKPNSKKFNRHIIRLKTLRLEENTNKSECSAEEEETPSAAWAAWAAWVAWVEWKMCFLRCSERVEEGKVIEDLLDLHKKEAVMQLRGSI